MSEENIVSDEPVATETVESVETVEAPELHGDDRWNAIDLSATLDKPEEEAQEAEPEVEKEAEVTEPDRDTEGELSPPAPLPDESATEAEEDEEPELADITAAEGKPANLSRRKLKEVEKNVINPFRDPEAPIMDVLDAFEKFHPTRTLELKQAIVNESARLSPDAWVQALTGVPEITVDKVKELVARESTLPPVEPTNDSETIIEYLDSLYGEDWKDSANDNMLAAEDRKLIGALRRQVELESTTKEKDSAWQAKFDTVQKELDALKPQIESFEATRKAEEVKAIDTVYQATVNEYREAVEKKSLPKLFTDLNLVQTEADTESVKGVKELIKSRFAPSFGASSDFDMFMVREFSARESVGKIIQRVDKLLQDAAVAEASKRTQDAAGLKNQALMEQDTLAVLSRKAAQEFLSSTHIAPIMKVLEENADLQRRLGINGKRVEIVDSSAPPSGDNWRETLKDSVNKWDADLIGKRLSESAR